jgi:Thioredoxin-like [2Fe-2S] ferredoxin
MRSLLLYLVHLLSLTSLGSVEAFTPLHVSSRNHRPNDGSMSQSSEVEQAITATSPLDPKEAEKFKVLTCMSTSCCQKRKALGLDSLATFGAIYSRIHGGNAPTVRLEEAPCLGACKKAPCVAVEHDDFDGTVSLLGMTDDEFSSRV